MLPRQFKSKKEPQLNFATGSARLPLTTGTGTFYRTARNRIYFGSLPES